MTEAERQEKRKRCSCCKLAKPLAEFSSDRSRPDVVAEVGQVWRAKPPGKERVEVRRIWNRPEHLTASGKQVITRCARCHPVHGGRPLIIAVADLEREFDKEADRER